MTLQGHYLGRIATPSVASQCFALGLIAATPMAGTSTNAYRCCGRHFKRAVSTPFKLVAVDH
jgi:hypothetical protein